MVEQPRQQEDQSLMCASCVGALSCQRVIGSLEHSSLSVFLDDGVGKLELSPGSFADVRYDCSHEGRRQIEHLPFTGWADRHAVMYFAGIAGNDVSRPRLNRSAAAP